MPPLVARGGDFRKKIGGDKKVENLMKFSAFLLIRAAQSAAHLLLKEKADKIDARYQMLDVRCARSRFYDNG